MEDIYGRAVSALKGVSTYAHHHPVVKFAVIFLFFFVYLVSATMSYGLESGTLVALVTWTFFVFCTPVADAGLLLDFPLRMITGIRMLYLEVLVWVIALLINIFTYLTDPAVYSKTILTRLLSHIALQPFPYWSIVLLCAAGTFMSIRFGDEILDVLSMKKEDRWLYFKHKVKYKAIVFISIIAVVIVLYSFLLNQLGISIPLF